MAGTTIEVGRKVLVRYYDEPKLWMERLVLHPSRPEKVLEVTGVTVPSDSSPWWILTPDGDVYPELLEVSADIADVVIGNDEGAMVKKAGQIGPRLTVVHKFQKDREAGEPNMLLVMKARAEAERCENEGLGAVNGGANADALLLVSANQWPHDVTGPLGAGQRWLIAEHVKGLVAGSEVAVPDGLPIVDGHPIGIEFGHRIGRVWFEAHGLIQGRYV